MKLYDGKACTEMSVAEFGRKMPYYKMLTHNMVHNGYQYRVGLNVDTLRFRPEGDCERGGLYFACEDILWFYTLGGWVAEVTLPEDARVYRNPLRVGEQQKWKADKFILGAPHRLDSSAVLDLMNQGARVFKEDALHFAYMAVRDRNMKLLTDRRILGKLSCDDRIEIRDAANSYGCIEEILKLRSFRC